MAKNSWYGVNGGPYTKNEISRARGFNTRAFYARVKLVKLAITFSPTDLKNLKARDERHDKPERENNYINKVSLTESLEIKLCCLSA